MKQRLITALGAGLLLVGCATTTPEQVEHAARSATDYELCEAMVTGQRRWTGIISGEISRRNVDCNQHAALIALRLQQRQAESRALQDAANFFNRTAPQLPRQTNCTSYRIGNTVQADCR